MDATPVPPPEEPFECSGGDLSLDFANTWGDRGRPDTDGLRSYPRLLAFARQVGLGAAPDPLDGLAARAETPAAGAALQTARDLREALYGIFSARAQGREVPSHDLATLNRVLHEALPHLCLEEAGPSFAWCWREGDRPPTWPLWPIARAAAELLTREPPAPVRECGGSRCTWLFLDASRGRSRRWCSMAGCGNREKARRHYRRARGQEPGPV
jgi:predicted RNA-binding Zn ribbon-like protein